MKHTPVFIFILSLCSFLRISAQQNEDFESSVPAVITSSNQIAGWTIVSGTLQFPGNACDLSTCCPGPPAESQIINCPAGTGYIDPVIGGVYPLYSVFGGGAANGGNGINPGIGLTMMGTKIIRLNSNINNYSVEKLTKSFVVTSGTSLFKFAYATVFATGHNCCDGSSFRILMTVGGNTVACPAFTLAGPSIQCTTVTPNQYYLPGSGAPYTGSGTYVFNKWMYTSLDLSAYIGQTVTIDFHATDCNAGGHYGYVYLDSQCSSMNVISNGNNIPVPNPSVNIGSCGASAFTITAPPGQGPYSWSSGQIAIPPNLSQPNYTNTTLISNQSGTLELIMNPLVGCGPVSKTLNLVVTPAAAPISITGSTLLCSGQSTTLTASGSASYTWSNNFFTPSISISPTVTTGYTVNGLDNNNCPASANVQVSVSPNPTLIISGASSVCLGTSANFAFSGATTYSLNGSAVSNTVNILPVSSANYTVSASNVCGNVTQTFNLLVNSGCSDVWPGDVNSDGLTNNLDVLELGLHMNVTGLARPQPGNLWQSHFANNWMGQITNGKNVCHANSNGDGVIDANDTMAIFQNYNLTHQFRPLETNTTAAHVWMTSDQAFVSNDQWANVSVYLGEVQNTILLNGLAFTMNFENDFIQTDSIVLAYVNSYMDQGANLHFRKNDYSNGRVYAATTHTTNVNVNGNGKVANFRFKTKTVIGFDTVVKLTISGATKSFANGVLNLLTGGTVAVVIKANDVGVKENNRDENVNVFPNPNKGYITFESDQEIRKVELISSDGRVVYTRNPNEHKFRADIRSLEEGIYAAKIYSAEGRVSVRKVVYKPD